ncbi:hypothetical protein [Lysobacter solisilvae (ex Woo and Kim 2020)]|uniref:Fibronectin n=1 Tax=Agrilutibacter terrestris TaxID=2865112 RepID=A0A7H0G0P8_9GAMM|nr:hypothetical protein [Lysobacter terrestris]QNP41864.1 hypothetical protein H8B22_06625 [Lysobacter terrestris]
MRTLLRMCVLLCLLAMPAWATATSRAVWTWERDSYALLESRAAADAAFAFLRDQHVDTFYLYADAYDGRNLIAQQPQRYRDFIATAHARGFKVYALLGSAYLNTERYILPERRRDATAMLQRVLDYNAAAPEAARFDGVNLDIEPHLLDQWNDASREDLLRDLIEVSAQWMRMKRDSGQTLAIGLATPFWFDGIPVRWRGTTKPASEHLADCYDYLALMDYRDHADGRDGIVAHAAKEMDYAQRIGKTVVIGLELGPSEPKKVTFHHRSEADLRREMAATEAAYAQSKAFAGFALHHYRSYREWIDAQRPR